jgi:hypothetical protein
VSTDPNQCVIIVTKLDDTKRIVKIIYDRKLKGYRFVNLTEGKEHICPCVFNTEEEAMNDLEDHIKRGLVKSYKTIKINFAQLLVE